MAPQSKTTRPGTKTTEQPAVAPSTQNSAAADLSTGQNTKPDQAAYNEEQNVLRSKIDALGTQLVRTIDVVSFSCAYRMDLCRMLSR